MNVSRISTTVPLMTVLMVREDHWASLRATRSWSTGWNGFARMGTDAVRRVG
jgi:hypothetical protein